MSKPYRSFILEEPIFHSITVVGIGDVESALDHLKERYPDFEWTEEAPGEAFTLIATSGEGHQECYVWFSPRIVTRRGMDINVIVHEAHHAAMAVLQGRDVTDAECMGETGSYYLGWLVGEMVSGLKGKRGG